MAMATEEKAKGLAGSKSHISPIVSHDPQDRFREVHCEKRGRGAKLGLFELGNFESEKRAGWFLRRFITGTEALG
jgi:hypothetical protein